MHGAWLPWLCCPAAVQSALWNAAHGGICGGPNSLFLACSPVNYPFTRFFCRCHHILFASSVAGCDFLKLTLGEGLVYKNATTCNIFRNWKLRHLSCKQKELVSAERLGRSRRWARKKITTFFKRGGKNLGIAVCISDFGLVLDFYNPNPNALIIGCPILLIVLMHCVQSNLESSKKGRI